MKTALFFDKVELRLWHDLSGIRYRTQHAAVSAVVVIRCIAIFP